MKRTGRDFQRWWTARLAAGLGVLLITGACVDQATPAPTARPEASASAPAAVKVPVAKVVFVGQKECCDCTRDRIQKSWAALEQALAGKPGIVVERLDLDGDSSRVAEIETLGKIMVVPGVYLLSADGKLIRLLQGEVSREQVAASL
jgi:hypothetical protein